MHADLRLKNVPQVDNGQNRLELELTTNSKHFLFLFIQFV